MPHAVAAETVSVTAVEDTFPFAVIESWFELAEEAGYSAPVQGTVWMVSVMAPDGTLVQVEPYECV
jgi:hypothetical protein